MATRKITVSIKAVKPASQTEPSEPLDTALIPVKLGAIGGMDCLVVDGRDLHQFLGVRHDFTNWLKGRIETYGLVEGRDFLQKTDSPNLADHAVPSTHGGDRRSIKFTLSLSTAKELAMVERGPKGGLVRRYFIQCEQELIATKTAPKSENLLNIAAFQDILRSVGQMSKIADVEAFREYTRILGLVGTHREVVAIELAHAVASKKFLQLVEILRGQNVDAKHAGNILLVLQAMQLASSSV